jgi:anaerobic selenocysteine-containing dehydrogenase
MSSAPTQIATHPAVCPLDCPDTCSLSIQTEAGMITQVRGSDVNPFTAGKICNKVAHGLAGLVHGPNRLTQPLRRSGKKGSGEFQAITWEVALDEIHERYQQIIAEHGPEAIVPFNYAGPHGLLAGGSMALRFFNKLGASSVDRPPLCGGIQSAAYESIFGETPGIPPEEIAHSKLIVIWGFNITVSGLHLTRVIRNAQSEGAKLVVIDPKRTPIAERADLHLASLPGTDVVLGYAIAAELERLGALDHDFIRANVSGADAYLERARTFSLEKAAEICGLKIEDLRTFAALFRDIRPSATLVGVGAERNRNGGGGIRASFALPILTGNFGKLGAGVCAGHSEYFPIHYDALEGSEFASEGTREFNILDIPDHVLDPNCSPPIQSLFIFNHNPVAVHPRQNRMREALSREDLFVIGSDVSMTDSLAYADIILPAASHVECDDIYPSYGHQYLQRAEPVIAPVGDSLPNTEIFRRLARRFGFSDPAFKQTDRELIDEAIDRGDPRLGGRSGTEIGIDEALDLAQEGSPTVLRGALPTTPSGKAELFSTQLEEERGEGLPSYRPLESNEPFYLVSPSSDRRTNSTFGGVEAMHEEITVEMHPLDAAANGLSHGQNVQLSNEQGAVILKLRISDAVRTGTLYVPKGSWLKDNVSGQSINALIPGHKADLADGACYNDTRVKIAASDEAS